MGHDMKEQANVLYASIVESPVEHCPSVVMLMLYLYHHHLLSEGFESATAISTLKQHAGSYDEVLLAVLQSHCVNDDNRVDLEKEQRNASLFKALKLTYWLYRKMKVMRR